MSACGAFCAAQRYRLQAASVSNKKAAKAVAAKIKVKPVLACRKLGHQSARMPNAPCSIEVPLERPPAADVQGDAVGPPAQHLGVAQFQRDDVKSVLFQKLYERRLIAVDHDKVRIDAEDIHVDPVTADAFGQIVGIISVCVLHRRAVDDFPLLENLGQGIVIDPSGIAEDQAVPQGYEGRVDMT